MGMDTNSPIHRVQGMGMGVQNTRTQPNFDRFSGVGTEWVANPALDYFRKMFNPYLLRTYIRPTFSNTCIKEAVVVQFDQFKVLRSSKGHLF